MDRDQDVEVELYEENVGNLNYSTPNESRSSSPDRFLPVLSSQEPTERRLEENPFVAIDPRPDPEELSHAPTSQVPRIHDSCHSSPNFNVPGRPQQTGLCKRLIGTLKNLINKVASDNPKSWHKHLGFVLWAIIHETLHSTTGLPPALLAWGVSQWVRWQY